MSGSEPTLPAALAAFRGGRLREAEEFCARLLALHPREAEVCHLAGVVFASVGRQAEAAEVLNRAAALAPESSEIRRNQGAVLAGLRRYAEAIPALEAAHRLAPEDPVALDNLALALKADDRAETGIGLLRGWLERRSSHAAIWFRLGALLAELRRTTEAIDALARAVSLDPTHADALRLLAGLRYNRFEFAAAAHCCRALIAADPKDAAAHRKLGEILAIQDRLEESREAYRRAQAIAPDPGVDFILAMQLPPVLPSEAAIDEVRATYETRLDELVQRAPRLEDPARQVGHAHQFYLAYHGRNDRALQEKLAAAYLASAPSLASRAPHIDGWKPGARIRLGVVSTHLGGHTVGHVTRGLLERLDRERFELVLFRPGDAAPADGERETAVELPTRLAEARNRIAEAKLDLLYFPDIGMSALTYFLAFARLAPVQCIGWGHPDTTGIPNADYWLSAADWEPDDGERHYSERLVRLRHFPFCYPRPAAAPVKSRAELGLPARGRLYLAPMSLFKFHPRYDSVLARILDADGEAHLLLAAGHAPEWNELLRNRIAGVSPGAAKRIRFLPWMSFQDFQALAGLGDAFLDPIYFGGGRTSLDLFAQGIPIVNWPGPFMRSRITYGFYRRMGMTDLVATDLDDYAALALGLAREPDWRAEMRRTVAERSAVLYENEAAVREIEAFFAAAVEAAAAGRGLVRWPFTH